MIGQLIAAKDRLRVATETALMAGLVLRGLSRASLARCVEELATQHPHRSALLFEDRHYSYRSLNAAANRVSATLISLGAQPDDVVCTLSDNRPELLFCILGANKIGVATSLLPRSLEGADLVHAVSASEPRWIVVTENELPRLEEVLPELPVERHNVLVWTGERELVLPQGARDMSLLVRTAADQNPKTTGRQVADHVALHLQSPAHDGIHRTAVIKNQRLMRLGTVLGRSVLRLTSRDVTYIALPMQDGMVALAAWSAALATGGTVAMRRSFDGDEFWRDCIRYGATCFAYSGELCSALLEAPSHPRERAHHVRTMTGTGLREAAWKEFTGRFEVPQVMEYLEAPAGNIFLHNLEEKPGMLGRLSPGLRVARLNDVSAQPLRDHRGRVVECRPGEVGVLLRRIDQRHSFDGYLDLDHSHAYLVTDAFGEGSEYFNTGIRVRVHRGHYVSLP